MSDESAPDEAAVRISLHRVLASDAFRSAPRLSAFLSFVVTRTLEGASASLKGYVVATEALGRGQDFDPQADPIVRVEAGRLRRALDAYYVGPGREDPVLIEIPRGGYVPRFCPNRSIAPRAEMMRPARGASWRAVAAWSSGLSAVGLLASLALATAWGTTEEGPAEPERLRISVAATPPLEGTASLLAEALAHFDDLVVIDGAVADGARHAPYLLTLRPGEADMVMASLRHRSSGRIVWARGFGNAAGAVAQVAAAVGGIDGAVAADERARPVPTRILRLARGEGARSICDGNASSVGQRARAALAAGDPPAAIRIVRGATPAARDAPEALGTLAAALLATGDLRGGIDAARRARQRNPYDVRILGELAEALAAAGQANEAAEFRTRAASLSPTPLSPASLGPDPSRAEAALVLPTSRVPLAVP